MLFIDITQSLSSAKFDRFVPISYSIGLSEDNKSGK
mgnify:FL=1